GAEAGATELPLDGEERVEQLPRCKRGLDGDRAVEERRLVEVSDRVGLAEARDGDDLDPRHPTEQLDGVGQRRRAIAEVRPETDVRASHNGSLIRSCRPASGAPPTT